MHPQLGLTQPSNPHSEREAHSLESPASGGAIAVELPVHVSRVDVDILSPFGLVTPAARRDYPPLREHMLLNGGFYSNSITYHAPLISYIRSPLLRFEHGILGFLQYY